MEQVTISSGNSQTPCDHNSTPNLLNSLNLPTPTRGTNSKAEFSIAIGGKQFGVNHLPLLLQGLDGACDLYPSAEKGIRREVSKVREWIWCFWRQGLENPLKVRR